MKLGLIITMSASFALAACAGEEAYIPSKETYMVNKTAVINLPKDKAWKQAVKNIGSSFFVINTIDKESGLINISYSGDPQKYVDCGRITSHVKNLRGDRHYDFSASSPLQDYETLTNERYFHIVRKMALEGRINLILQEDSPNTTLATVSIKYVLTKNVKIEDQQGSQEYSDVIGFNTGSAQTFSGGTTCVDNGELEKEVLDAAIGSQ